MGKIKDIAISMPKMHVHHGEPCRYCRREMNAGDFHLAPTRDHYPVPKSRGGTKTVVCCKKCNNLKGDMSAEEWALYMAENPEWWLITRKERKEKRAIKREANRTEKWGPRATRVIRQAEKPSTPMREALSEVRFTGMVAHRFNQMYGRKT